MAETLQSECCQGLWMKVCTTVCCRQANQLDPTRFHWTVYNGTCTYICVSHYIQCFIHTRVFLLPFSSTGFSGWNTFMRGVARAQHLETAAACAVDRKRPSRPLLMNINYVTCHLLSWLAERQRSSQINESYSVEVLLWILIKLRKWTLPEGNVKLIFMRQAVAVGFVNLPPALLSLKFAHTYNPKGHRRVFELGIYMYSLME